MQRTRGRAQLSPATFEIDGVGLRMLARTGERSARRSCVSERSRILSGFPKVSVEFRTLVR